MMFVLLLLFILAFFFLWPVIKLLWKVYKIRRDMQRVYDRASSAGNSRTNHSRSYRDGYENGRRRKKIDPTIGEYIEYEEIKVDSEIETERQYGASRIEYVRQQQVTDAEWEELN